MCAQRLCAQVYSAPRGRRTWEVSILLVLAVVIVSAIALNLANLEPLDESVRGAPPPSSQESADASAFNPIVVGILWALSAVLVVLIVLLLLRRPANSQRLSWRNLLPSILGILLFLVLLNSIPRSFTPLENETSEGRGEITLPDETSSRIVPSFAEGFPGGSREVLLLLATFGALAWIVSRLRSTRRFHADLTDLIPTTEDPRGSAREALQETIRDLEIGADVRMTILACFQRFCGLLRARGIVDQDAFTAREIEGLAVRTFSLSREASASLTSLFEEARYSVHSLGETERERALESLGRIRASLEA